MDQEYQITGAYAPANNYVATTSGKLLENYSPRTEKVIVQPFL